MQSGCFGRMTAAGRQRITTGVLGEAPIRELEIALAGSIVGPGEPNYETARRARGGAHSAAGFSTCDDGIVLDLAQLNDVQVDVGSRRALAGGGSTWKIFDAATQAHGLATTGGLVSSTGLGGFVLGGGVGQPSLRRVGDR